MTEEQFDGGDARWLWNPDEAQVVSKTELDPAYIASLTRAAKRVAMAFATPGRSWLSLGPFDDDPPPARDTHVHNAIAAMKRAERT